MRRTNFSMIFQGKLKESENRDKFLDLAREPKIFGT